MFYRVFGRNGYGKTAYIFEKLRECVNEKRRAFLIVPEQSAVDTERQVIKALGGKSNLYIEVINFKRLCNRVFRQTGGLTGVHLDEGAKKMLMMSALSSVSPFLKEYSASVRSADFATKALSMVNELRAGMIGADKLDKVREKLLNENADIHVCSKLHDIAVISSAYDAEISRIPGSVTDIYEKLCEKLKEDSFFEGCDVFFDSFYGFTARELEIISLIAESADNTYVTFCCNKYEDDVVFERGIKSAKACGRIAEKCGCELFDVELCDNKRHRVGSSLYAFENNFSSDALTSTSSATCSDDSLVITRCKDIYDEVKYAVSTVLSLERSGAKLSDIVICARNIKDYVGVIDTVFEKAKIPLGKDEPETLSESALFELVNSALEASSTFSSSAVLRYVKSGLSGLSEEEADLFETYVRTWDISPSLMRKDEDFTMNPDGYVDSEPDEYILSVVNSARSKVFTCLDSLRLCLKTAETIKEKAVAICNLLEDIRRVSQKEEFDDGNAGESLALLYECLDSFVSCSGEKRMSLSDFMNLFKNCGKDYDTGHIPSLTEQVAFSDVSLMRCENRKYIILLGVNSGVFPSPCKNSSLLLDEDKELLRREGIELSEKSDELVYDELFLAYCALTSAAEKCFVSYLSSGIDSSPLFPSVIISTIKRLTGIGECDYDSLDFENNFFGNELLFEEMVTLGKSGARCGFESYFSKIDEYKERLLRNISPENQKDYLEKETADALYGNVITTSYSKIEKMAGCPFSHFCTYTLKLKPEPKALLGPAEAGSVMHKILEELVPLLCTQTDGQYPDEKKARGLVLELLGGHLSRIAHTDTSSIPKRFIYLYNRLSRLLFEISSHIVKELRVSKFVPRDFELNISRNADIKPVPLDIGNGCTLYIIGQIDRVDVYQKDGRSYVRIIDYKTGKKSFKLDDIRNGFNLQMLLYLSAIANDKSGKYGEEIIPAGVLYSNVVARNDSASLGKDNVSDVANKATKPVSSGIFIDDESILLAMDPTENSIYLPIGRKNGEITKKDAVTSLEEMGKLLEFANITAKELACQMRMGLKSVTPFDGKSKGLDIDPCKYCDMKNVCLTES